MSKGIKAFTLIEMLAVVAAVAFLAAALLVPMIRQLDAIASRKETETLKAFVAAFRSHITRAVPKAVPAASDWATTIATQLGLQMSAVTNNPRGLRRVFLVDPALQLGSVRATNLPYNFNITTYTGFTNPPVSPRLLLISSLSAPLPNSLVSGVGATSGTNAFNNLWSTPEGQLPTGWVWGGRGEDLKVERFNLEDLFVQVIFNNRDTNLTPRFRVDDSLETPVLYGSRNTYLLKGSELRLLNAVGVLEYSEILNAPKSFTFEYGTWQGEAFVGHAVSQTSPLDLQRVMNTFMNAPTNPAAKFGASQLTVSNALVVFLNEYVAWRDNGYPGQFSGQGNPPNSLEQAQTALKQEAVNLLTRP
ncbi:MAG TPA: prepilin-type N-terminal cleavage/methylation domain-containing protein [Candidatus Kapabacteria bacterium]|nr:prepilin-type N-terminal cleavage/methylation domain-containing protein [Candidatus Kapabacteria bacterium]